MGIRLNPDLQAALSEIARLTSEIEKLTKERDYYKNRLEAKSPGAIFTDSPQRDRDAGKDRRK